MIKVFEDKKRAVDFDNSIDNCIARCNELISIFHEFQSFMRINTASDFENLVDDPAALFDHLLVNNVQLTTSSLKADPEQLAKLFNIDRPNYLNLVAGRAVRITDCLPCQRVKIKQGQMAISSSEYQTYKQFLIFAECEFIRNEVAIDERKKDFTTYATTEAQIKVVNLHSDLVKMLNEYCSKYPIGNGDKKIIAKALHLYLTQAESGDFMKNTEFLINEITTA